MFISLKNGNAVLQKTEDKSSYAKLNAPLIVLNGEEKTFTIVKEDLNQTTSEYEGIVIVDEVTPYKNGLLKARRKIKNTTKNRIRFKSIFEMETVFKMEHYCFPGFNYDSTLNGDFEGGTEDISMVKSKSNTPKGLTKDGAPWIFSYDREGIPACSISENKEKVFSIFASDVDSLSLRGSSSMIKTESGTVKHRIFHPVQEMPYTYGQKNSMEAPYEEYMHLAPGEQVQLNMFIFVGVPKYLNYGTAAVMEACDTAFPFKKIPELTLDRVWELGITYFKYLLKDCHGVPMVSGHVSDRLFKQMHAAGLKGEALRIAMEDPKNHVLDEFSARYEIGWADQGAMIARLFILDGYKNNNPENIEVGEKMLDAYVASQWENGLMYPLYGNNFVEDVKKRQLPDACNMGWAMTELMRSYNVFKEKGKEKKNYYDFSVKIADFALNTYSDEYGFPKTWYRDGSPKSTEGTVGGFMIMGLLEVYKATKKKEYLDLAVKAMDFYYKRDLDNFVCMAGALDCACIDKETAYPFLVASLDLYEITGDKLWVERAEKAAYYFFSWMFWFDCLYDENSEFTKYGYYTTGGTLISAEHSAIDPWGALLCRDMIKLYHITNNESFKTWAQMTWCNALMGITKEEGVSVHGNVRPLGSQNEGFFHCRWTKYRPTCEERGHYNDNLQTWMGAWRLFTISSLSDEDLKFFE